MKTFHFSSPRVSAALEISRESPSQRYDRIVGDFRENNIYFDGPFENWRAATSVAGGYDAPIILRKAIDSARVVAAGGAKYERDTVLFYKQSFSHEMLAWLFFVASVKDNRLRVVDFGGALGSSYFQHRAALTHLDELKWCVVEQQHLVDAAKSELSNEALSFSANFGEAVQNLRPNLLILSGVLQYLEEPHTFLRTCFAKGIDFILIDRTTAQYDMPERPYVQHVPKWIYEASYASWFMDANHIEDSFREHSYEIIDRFENHETFGKRMPTALKDLERWGMEVPESEVTPEWPYLGWFIKKVDSV
jgi:putative methyltransferase (TIGR04325 family)